jgi:hypothetical protein
MVNVHLHAQAALPSGWTAHETYFDFRQLQELFLFAETSAPAVGPISRPIGHLGLVFWRQNDGHLKLTTLLEYAGVENDGSCTSTVSHTVRD